MAFTSEISSTVRMVDLLLIVAIGAASAYMFLLRSSYFDEDPVAFVEPVKMLVAPSLDTTLAPPPHNPEFDPAPETPAPEVTAAETRSEREVEPNQPAPRPLVKKPAPAPKPAPVQKPAVIQAPVVNPNVGFQPRGFNRRGFNRR